MLKKKIIVLFVTMISIFAMISLSSCKKDKLAEHERAFFDTFTEIMSENYTDPSSVKFISIECSYMDGGIVQFTTSRKNSYGGNTQNEYVLVTRFLYATEYYKKLNEDALLNSRLYAQSFDKGYFRSTDTIRANTADPKGTALEWIITDYLLGDDLRDSLTYNVGNLNTALNDYKASQGW